MLAMWFLVFVTDCMFSQWVRERQRQFSRWILLLFIGFGCFTFRGWNCQWNLHWLCTFRQAAIHFFHPLLLFLSFIHFLFFRLLLRKKQASRRNFISVSRRWEINLIQAAKLRKWVMVGNGWSPLSWTELSFWQESNPRPLVFSNHWDTRTPSELGRYARFFLHKVSR